jgi:predicted glycoside hydrolase/deacetylase ChbG (UPF0249 family)
LTEARGDRTRRLIVNADDFGRSPPINRGTIQAHENGIVTSASLMVRWPAAADAAAYAMRRPGLSLGLHLDLAEWRFEGEGWARLYAVADVGDENAVTEEARTQLERFRELTGREPTHLDSHQHIHRNEPARTAIAALADELRLPLRDHHPAIRYAGEFYGQTTEGHPLPDAIRAEALVAIIEALPPGTTELGCHPGDGSEFPDPYDRERRLELSTLCDPRVRHAIEREGIDLVTFADAGERVRRDAASSTG